MKKVFIAVLLIVGLLIPAVSANEIIIDEDLSEYVDTSVSGEQYYTDGSQWRQGNANRIAFTDITKAQTLYYLVFELSGNYGVWLNGTTIADGRYDFSYTFNGEERPGVLYINRKTNAIGSVSSTVFTVFLNDWDIGDLTGAQAVTCPFYFYRGDARSTGTLTKETNAYLSGDGVIAVPIQVTEATAVEWKHSLTVEQDSLSYFINIDGVFDDKYYTAQVNFSKDGEIFSTFSNRGKELYLAHLKQDIDLIEIISPSGTVYEYPLIESDIPGDSDAIPVDIYIQNAQSGALISNSRILIEAAAGDPIELFEVVNETLPAGTKTYHLQPTGSANPNPRYYRITAIADGYNAQMPYMDHEIEYPTKIYIAMDPTGGAPEDETKTFIDFYVRDLNAKPVSGATVNFGDYTLLTNSAGYTIFEVTKNATYTYTVSKSGYNTLTGNVVIADNPRYPVNTVIAPAATPTTTTPIPTSTSISPTPTMTAPTGEPVSNLLEWFAAHFGMLLGGGVEIGKIFMWLCFTVPVGVYVGKEAKAGAAGFMAGAGIVTLFFVLIGWVPVWLVVLLALIIGLLYAKVFNTQDNGGGR